MIIFCKKTINFLLGVTSFIAIVLFVLLKASPTQAYWLSNVFHDKTFIYILLPIYLFGNFFIDSSVSIIQITKMKTRKAAIFFTLIQQILYAFIFITICFVLISVFTLLRFGKMTEMGLVEILISYLTYLEEILLISNAALMFRKSKIKRWQELAYVVTYGLVVLEVTMISELNMLLPIDINLCFSWIFSRYEFAPIVLLVLNIMFVMRLMYKCSYEDIF